MGYQPGDRVFAVLSADQQEVQFLGHGIYTGDIPAPKIGGIRNPYIKLDNGHDAWGYECWWGAEKFYEHWLRGRKVVNATLPRWEEPTLLVADDQLLGPFCENADVHGAHDPCPGLRPADYIQKPCSNTECDRMVWVPPDIPDEVQAICSTDCAVALMTGLIG